MQEIKLISDGTVDLYSIIIPSVITIVGFIINIYITKTSIKKEILKSQKDLMIKKNIEVMEFFINIIVLKDSKDADINSFRNIINLIYSYGSNDLIRLFGEYQQFNYSENKGTNEFVKMFAFYTLILSQIKYDLTGEVVKPDSILKIRLKDFYSNEKLNGFNTEINLIVEKMHLNRKFKLK